MNGFASRTVRMMKYNITLGRGIGSLEHEQSASMYIEAIVKAIVWRWWKSRNCRFDIAATISDFGCSTYVPLNETSSYETNLGTWRNASIINQCSCSLAPLFYGRILL